MKGMSVVLTKGVVKRFGKVEALRGLSVEAPKGVSGLVGPNGSGKTTLINILLGLLKPDDGEAHMLGLDCWKDSYEIRRRVGVLRENPGYPKHLTGRRYLKLTARLRELPQPEAEAVKALKSVELLEASGRSIGEYSAGMLQRLGLAQALMGDPELLILDEPTANLDPMSRIKLLETISRLHEEEQTSFIISTHALLELEKVCEWLTVINEGQMVDQGSVKNLVEKYSARTCRLEVSNPELFAEKLKEFNLVVDAHVEEGIVYCRVKDFPAFSREMPKLVSDLGLSLRSFQPLYSSIEEIYRRVMEE